MANIESSQKQGAVYGSLLSQFRDDITMGRMSDGTLLPGEKEMARIHGISRWAVREMLARLSEDGLVRKIAGKGTIVVGRQPGRPHRAALTVDVILDNTDRLDANEYAMELLRRLELNSHMMRRPFEFSNRLVDFTGREQDDIATIRKVNADATVIMPFSRQCRDFLEMFTGMDRLVVAVAAELSSKRVPQVFVDDVEGVRKGVRYLQHIGHRRIAMIAPVEYSYRNGHSRIRQDTFIDMMRAAGCEWTMPMTDQVSYAYAPVRACVTRWMKREDAPTALFVADGNWLAPVKAALDLMGKRVPEDVTLISYDDVLESRLMEPAVTVIRQPLDTAAHRVYEVLLDHLEKSPRATLQGRVPPELVVRESSCPPRG